MSTPIITFADSEVNLRFRQPFLSQGIDNKATGTTADGVYRGFRVTTSGTAMTVAVQADSTFNDHVAAALSPSGELLSVRRAGGSFSLNLTAFASKTVVLALVGTYTLGKATKVTLSAFQLLPVDEFTGAGDSIIPLGVVVVPASGTIAAASITPRFRREAWQRRGSGEVTWAPLLQNGGFERSIVGLSTATEAKAVQGWEAFAGNSFTLAVQASDVHSGNRALALTAPSATTMTSGGISQWVTAPVEAGKFLRLEVFVKQRKVLVGATVRFQLNFVDQNNDDIGDVFSVAVPLTGVDSAYRLFTDSVVIPTGAFYLRKVSLVMSSVAAPSSGDVFYFDDVQVWLESQRADSPYTFADSFAREVNTSVVRVFDPLGTMAQDGAQLSYARATPSGEGSVTLGRVRNTLQTNTADPAWTTLGRLFDIGKNLLATAANVIKARFHAKFANAFTFTLMNEFVGDTATGFGAFRTYVGPNGIMVRTVNAFWTESTALWAQDNATKVSLREDMVGDTPARIDLYSQTAGAAAWVDGAWSPFATLGVTGSSVATDLDVGSLSADALSVVGDTILNGKTTASWSSGSALDPDPDDAGRGFILANTNTSVGNTVPFFWLHSDTEASPSRDGFVAYTKRIGAADDIEWRLGIIQNSGFVEDAFSVAITGEITALNTLFISVDGIKPVLANTAIGASPAANRFGDVYLTGGTGDTPENVVSADLSPKAVGVITISGGGGSESKDSTTNIDTVVSSTNKVTITLINPMASSDFYNPVISNLGRDDGTLKVWIPVVTIVDASTFEVRFYTTPGPGLLDPLTDATGFRFGVSVLGKQ